MFQKSSYKQKKIRPNIIKSFLPLVGKGQQIIPRKERKNTKKCSCEEGASLSLRLRTFVCVLLSSGESVFLKGFLSVVVVVVVACLLLPGVLSNHEGIVRVLASQVQWIHE
jgi:hypothetical protein